MTDDQPTDDPRTWTPYRPEQQHTEQLPAAFTTSKRPRRLLRVVVGASAAVLVVGGASFAVGSAVAGTPSTQATARTQPSQQQQMPGSGPLYGGAGPTTQQGGTQETASQAASGSQVTGLVRIQTEIDFGQGAAAGTGMIVTSDGEVVTNHHVVAGATSIKATDMTTGKTYTAKVVGTDATDDVAVLQLQDASGLSTVRTDTDGVSVGDAVTAVGDAEGTARLSAASGTVTGLDQSITTQSEGTTQGERLRGLIEVDADVISGDSGGATYDSQGEVVGMTTAASSGSANVTGYAIPISTVLSIAGDLTDGTQSAKYAYGYPAFLGIGLAQGQGTTIAGVYDDTPASQAGLAAGDTITSVDGDQVSTTRQLTGDIAEHDAGDQVRIGWTDAQGGQESATVTLAQGPVA